MVCGISFNDIESHLSPADLEMGVNLNLTMLPAKLKTANYSTHQIGSPQHLPCGHSADMSTGKWHAGFYTPAYLPVSRGFDSSFGYMNGATTHFSQLFPQTYLPVSCQGLDIWNSTQNAFGSNGTCYNVEYISPDSLGSCKNGTKYNGMA